MHVQYGAIRYQSDDGDHVKPAQGVESSYLLGTRSLAFNLIGPQWSHMVEHDM